MTQPKWITDILLQKANLAPVVSEADSLLSNRGYAPAGEFLTNIAGQETLYGHSSVYDPTRPHSMGITQIDPVRYQDIVCQIQHMKENYPKAKAGYGADADFINKYMTEKGYENFDIANLATIKDGKYDKMSPYASDPMVNLLVTRMLLSMDKKNPIPGTSEEQANYWKKHWNTYAEGAAGKPEEFLDKISTYRPVDSTMDGYNKVNSAYTQ